jgi:hypothetical protein
LRNTGFSASVSDLALIMREPIETSFAHDGTSPQRASRSTRPRASGSGSSASAFASRAGRRAVTIGWVVVGATL